MMKFVFNCDVFQTRCWGLFFCFMLFSQFAYAADIVVDQGHGQAFVVEKEGPLDLSQLASVLTDHGGILRIHTGQFTEKVLVDADALVISGPFQPFVESEVADIIRYIEKGGRLCLMLHIPGPVEPLLRKLGVVVSYTPVAEQENILAANPKDFLVSNLLPHPITKGLEFFRVYGIWGVMGMRDNVKEIVSAGPKSWVDMNRNGKLDEPDGIYPYGMVVAGVVGKGHFVVFGDDAIFQNKFFSQENKTLGINLAQWLTGENKF